MIPIYRHNRSFAAADNVNTLVAGEVDARCPSVHDLLSADGEDHSTSAVHFTPICKEAWTAPSENLRAYIRASA